MTSETGTAEERLIEAIIRVFDLPDIIEALAWIEENCRVPANTETPGPFDLELAPHIAEPIQQINSFETEEILMDWATRNAKTFTCVFLLLYWIVNFSAPCGAISADLNLRDKLIEDKLYPALEACVKTKHLIPPRHLRKSTEALVGDVKVETAIASSPATLASFPCQFAILNEVGLWKLNSVKRLRDRQKNFGSFKKRCIEGKPEDKLTCTITALINQDDVQRRIRMVKCPHCRTWQRLKWGFGEPGAGIKWKKNKDGHSTRAKAMETVYYECVKGCQIQDGEERTKMLRGGVWCPEGCTLTRTGKIKGTPDVPSVQRVAFTKLSSLYSCLIDGWSQIVGEWFDCKDDVELRREFITGTLGEPYDPRPASRLPERIAKRLAVDIPGGIAPKWAKFITIAVDVGHDTQTDQLEYFWACAAWGRIGKRVRGHWVSEGYFGFGEDEQLIEFMLNCEIPHEDGGVLVPRGSCIGLDSGDGNVSEKVVLLAELITERFKKTTRAEALPLKGDSRKSHKLNWFEWGDTGDTKEERARNSRHGHGNLVSVNTERTQSWRENCITGRLQSTDRDFMSLPKEYRDDVESHEEMLMELAADYKDEKGRWKRHGKNERGDLWRYLRVMASVRTFKDTTWSKLSRNPVDKQKAVPKGTIPTGESMIEQFVGDGELRSIQEMIRGLRNV